MKNGAGWLVVSRRRLGTRPGPSLAQGSQSPVTYFAPQALLPLSHSSPPPLFLR